MTTEDAVAHGIKTTAGVVTSAALVMVGVFSIFATLPIIDMKELGIGLAAAVLIDATIVRAVLLPATMKLLGDWNWYLPSWLEWLPRLEHAGEVTPPAATRLRLRCPQRPNRGANKLAPHASQGSGPSDMGPDLCAKRRRTSLRISTHWAGGRSRTAGPRPEIRGTPEPRPDVAPGVRHEC